MVLSRAGSMSPDTITAIIAGCFIVLASLVTGLVAIATSSTASKDVKGLRDIIRTLDARIKELENQNHNLKQWVYQLCCQVRGYGGTPVDFEDTPPVSKTQPRPRAR